MASEKTTKWKEAIPTSGDTSDTLIPPEKKLTNWTINEELFIDLAFEQIR